MVPKILVLTGDGINCERETARAFSIAGGNPKIVHVNDLFENPRLIHDYQALALPGGFSFGDDLGSGQVLALKLEIILGAELREFVNNKNPVIGICNGFQVLTKLGLLPEPFQPRVMALGHNLSGNFLDRWVSIESDQKSVCIWTKGIKGVFSLPVRHGEGRVSFLRGEEEVIHRKLSMGGQIPLRYGEELNGSFARIAGICDSQGLIFGLMPHPEAAISKLQYAQSTLIDERAAPGIGLQFFQNCIAYIEGK